MNAKADKKFTPYILSALLFLLFSLVAVPVAIVLTILLSPFWNWFETASGIESFGHSGPSEWCYLVIYIPLLVVFVIYYVIRKKAN